MIYVDSSLVKIDINYLPVLTDKAYQFFLVDFLKFNSFVIFYCDVNEDEYHTYLYDFYYSFSIVCETITNKSCSRSFTFR